MDKYPLKSIGDLCDITKGETGLASAMPGVYPLVATGAERRSCVSYQFDTEAVCIPLVSSTGHGKKSLNHVHYQEGKFALGTILCALVPKEKSKLSAAYLHRYLKFNKDRKLVTLMKGAANVSLAVRDIAKIEIPVPPIQKQTEFITLFNKLEEAGSTLQGEFTTQSTLLTQLRQAILQEAIEGKLTSDWRKAHPVKKGDPETDAEALLAKIKTEKQKLIATGKIKKEKPLPPISPEDFPFNLPQGSVWARLGEIAEGFQYGSSSKSLKNGNVPVLRMGNIQNGRINWDNLAFSNDIEEISQYSLKYGDLLFNRTNSRELVGKTAIYDDERECIFAGYLVRFSLLGGSVPLLGNLVMNSLLHRNWCDSVKTDALGQSNINATKLRAFIFPLPPLAEQRIIVERVEKLLSHVDQLETQVTARKSNANALLQTVLRDAFEGAHKKS